MKCHFLERCEVDPRVYGVAYDVLSTLFYVEGRSPRVRGSLGNAH